MGKQAERHRQRIEQCFHILERAANVGDTCPTNAVLSDLLGYTSTARPAGLVNLLEVAGMILVERSNDGRVVTICKTGKRTAGVIRKPQPTDWTANQDAILMDGLAEELSFAKVGAIIGKTRDACRSRFDKIARSMGMQAA